MPVYVRIPGDQQWRRYPDDIDNKYFTRMLENDVLDIEWRPFGIRITSSDTAGNVGDTTAEAISAKQTE